MVGENVERRLAAILSADVVGYSISKLNRLLRSLALYRVRTVVLAMAILLVTMGVFPNADWALTAAEVQKLLASDGCRAQKLDLSCYAARSYT